MRAFLRCLLAGLIALSLGAAPAAVLAASLDTTADHVLGQTLFTTALANNGGLNASGLTIPYGVAVDARTGRLYVADQNNNRVLSWPNAAALANHQAADLVIGQPGFTTNTANNGGLGKASLNGPRGVAVDAQGNLFVADSGNNRVLEYNAPLANHAAAARVFGQPDFATGTPNTGGVSGASLAFPEDVALDARGNLFVADLFNNRVLEYNIPLDTGLSAANRVLGQIDVNHNSVNAGGLGASSLNQPTGVAVNSDGTVYVADHGNSRVLVYDNPLTTDTIADLVLASRT